MNKNHHFYWPSIMTNGNLYFKLNYFLFTFIAFSQNFTDYFKYLEIVYF